MLAPRFIEQETDTVRAMLGARHNPFDLDGLLSVLADRRALVG